MTAHAHPLGPTCRRCKTTEARCAFAQGCCPGCTHAFDGGRRRPHAREHGSPRGYEQHRYRSELPCQPCRDAHNAYNRKRVAS